MAKNRNFEEFDPAVEWSRSPEADAVKLSLPGKQCNNNPLVSIFPEKKLVDPMMDHAWHARTLASASRDD